MDDMTMAFLFTVLPRLPLLLVQVVGAILAIVYARALRGAAAVAGLGFGFLVAASLVSLAAQYFVMTAQLEGVPPATIGRTVALYGWVTTAASLIGTVLLMIAIFARRPAAPMSSA